MQVWVRWLYQSGKVGAKLDGDGAWLQMVVWKWADGGLGYCSMGEEGRAGNGGVEMAFWRRLLDDSRGTIKSGTSARWMDCVSDVESLCAPLQAGFDLPIRPSRNDWPYPDDQRWDLWALNGDRQESDLGKTQWGNCDGGR
jgi:hypothetical protein